jgi:hypothetical protein
MATTTTVEITYGSVTAEVEIIYRWYVPGNDPWRRTSGPSNSMPGSGDWENRMIGGSTTQVRMTSPIDPGFTMNLNGFTGVSVGSTGDGEFFGSGYLIPDLSMINWRVLSIV